MNNYFELEYLDLIARLKHLKSVTAPAVLRTQIRRLIPSLPLATVHITAPFSALRIVLVLASLIVLVSTGLAVATEKSQPGQLLFPVKKAAQKLLPAAASPVPVAGISSPEPVARDLPVSSPQSSPEAENIGGTEIPVLLPSPFATPPPASPSPEITVTTPVVEGTVSVGIDSSENSSPSPSPTPTSSPTSVIDLPLFDIDHTESGLQLKLGKENKPLFKIRL